MATLRSVQERLLTDDPDMAADERLMHDTLEGETDGMEVLHSTIRAIVVAEGMQEEAKARAATTAARAARYGRRAEALRGAVLAAMDALALPKIELPDVTVSLAKGRATLIVTDETMMPEEFLAMTTTYKPDKDAIKKAIESGAHVPGATLGNSPPHLAIRTR
jgi:hypothetical protein